MKRSLQLGKPINDLVLKIDYDDVHFCPNYSLSYNPFLGIIDGGRGIGKTTGFLIDGCKNAKKGFQFIYLRRYKSELKLAVQENVLGDILDDVLYKSDGSGGFKIIWHNYVLGYMVPLSIYRQYKSVRFPHVNRIIFDECIVLESGGYRYLKNEIIALLEFISTVDRGRGQVKTFCIGNNEDLFNPYYEYFNVPLFKDIYYNKERGLLLQHAKNSVNYMKQQEQTRMFSLINGTAYGDYHYGNNTLQTSNILLENIIPKPEGTRLFYRIILDTTTINAFLCVKDKQTIIYFERKDKVIKDNITYTLLESGKVNYYMGNLYKKKLKNFVSRFYTNKLVFFNDERCCALINWVQENL